MRIPLDPGGDARVQPEKCKGNTARQGLPLSTIPLLHHLAWRGCVPRRDGVKFRLSQAWVWLTEIFFFFPLYLQGTDLSWPIPQEAVSPHPIAVLAQKAKPSRLPTPTALGGDAAELSCRLAEWAVFGTPGPFLKAVAPPKWWEGSLSREITQGVDRCGGVLPALERQAWEAAPYQRPEGQGGAKHGVAGLCSEIYTTKPTSKHNRKRKASVSLLGNGLVQPVA